VAYFRNRRQWRKICLKRNWHRADYSDYQEKNDKGQRERKEGIEKEGKEKVYEQVVIITLIVRLDQ